MLLYYQVLLLFSFFTIYDQKKLDKKAIERKIQIENELPRFLDLLKPELEIGMPIETAIYFICQKFQSLLSEELLFSMQEMKLGISGWNQAVENVAEKYDVETLNDFAMDISTSYKKVFRLYILLQGKQKEIRQTHLLMVKERASKATNTILMPIIFFQFMPMIGFIVFPLVMEAITGFN